MGAEKEKLGIYGDRWTPEDKAKVAIIGVRKIDRERARWHGGIPMPSVYIPRRSRLEDTRRGGDDWVGGTLEDGEMVIDGLLRDSREEVSGLTLDYVTELDVIERKRGGKHIYTHLFAAIAYGEGVQNDELDAGQWVPLDAIPYRERLPRKYRDALTSSSGRLIVQGLALIVQNEPLPRIITPVLRSPEPVRLPQLLAA